MVDIIEICTYNLIKTKGGANMAVKDDVLAIFEQNKGVYLSGEQLAEQLSVSRNSIWKAVKTLQETGYQITAVTNKGYCLAEANDILSTQSLEKHFVAPHPFSWEIHKTLHSTNDALRIKAQQGAKEGLVIISDTQTGGKGRLGRTFHSPGGGTGIYMSLLLRPTIVADEALFITTSAAVAVAKAIETITGQVAEIKWVNDIFCRKQKVCGILTEASFNLEGRHLEYAILGIGINVQEPTNGFPSDLSSIAGGVLESGQTVLEVRSKLVVQILNNFWEYYQNLSQKSFLQEYRTRSLIIGQDIWVLNENGSIKAKAISITDNCELEVKYENGTKEILSAGEISIRPVL